MEQTLGNVLCRRASFIALAYTLAFGSFGWAADSAIETIPIYTYHTHPPFLVGDKRGFTYDLAGFLNETGEGVEFRVIPMSRPKINQKILTSSRGLLPWVNPAWFDIAEDKCLWLRPVLMADGNAVVSLRAKPVIYSGPESLSGLRLGGLHGHVYAGLDDVGVMRLDASNHIDNIRRLLRNRIDTSIMPYSAFTYFSSRERFSQNLYVAPARHSHYERRLMVIGADSELASRLHGMLKGPAFDRLIASFRGIQR